MNQENYHNLEELLNEVSPQANHEFYLALRQQVLDTPINQNATSSRKFRLFDRFPLWQPVVGAALLLLLIIFFTPIGQIVAQQVLRLGVFFVTTNPAPAEEHISNPPSEAEIYTSVTITSQLQEASALAGFPVYYPAYLPTGYTSDTEPPLQLVKNSQGTIVSAEAMFHSADGEYILYYAQHPFPPDTELSDMPLNIGAATAEPTTVLGNEALWLTNYAWGTAPDSAGNLQTVAYNVLIWTLPTTDGAKFYFWLGSEEQLIQAEMLRIAESLATE
ncbi:MAG TPA: hypothetical protein PLD25_08350 [Chloroflexota bacterium]|nr:hypothetical protein [Chloroflexota bacterium]